MADTGTPRRRRTAAASPAPAASTPRRSSRRSRSMSHDTTADTDGATTEADTDAEEPAPRRTPARSRTSKVKAVAVVETTIEEADDGEATSRDATPAPAQEEAPLLATPKAVKQTKAAATKAARDAAAAVKEGLKTKPTSNGHAARSSDRLARRAAKLRAVKGAIARALPLLPPLLLLASAILVLLLAVPRKPFHRGTYVDENALQPQSMKVEWDFGQVHWADEIAKEVAVLGEMSSKARSAYVVKELHQRGFTPRTQAYTYHLPASSQPHLRSTNGTSQLSGINAYARWASPRSDGKEAIVIAASWRSAWDGSDDPDVRDDDAASRVSADDDVDEYHSASRKRINVRGIASVLTLARYLKGHKNWSKDLIFVITDGHLEGMQAWLSALYASPQPNLVADPVDCDGALLWNAITVDYPSDSFSEISLLHEGLNGQLPNMDAINTVFEVADGQGVRVRLHGAPPDDGWVHGRTELGTVGELLDRHYWGGGGSRKYLRGLSNLLTQVRLLSAGHPSGIHGLFHRFHVDAVGVFAVPAPGPNGFFQMGRIVESSLRSFSNLIERLHHSQFFYLLTSPRKFVQVGTYIAVALLPSAALTIAGLVAYADEGRRASLRKLAIVAALRQSVKADDDVPLEQPTDHQILADVLALSAERAQVAGQLLSAQRMRSIVDGVQGLGRPLSAVFVAVALAHAVGLVALVVTARAPVDCAARGIEHCDQLRIVLVFLLAVLPIAVIALWRATRARKQDLTALLGADAQRLLSDGSSRRRAAARLLHSAAMLHAGVLLAVGSIVNFPLAAVCAGVLALPLYLVSIPPSHEGASELASTGDVRSRSVSPAGSDVAVPARRSHAGAPSLSRRLLNLAAALGLILLTPPALVILATIVLQACQLGLVLPFATWHPALPTVLGNFQGCGSPSIVQRALDTALWDWHILNAATIPALLLGFTPIALEGAFAAALSALA